MQVDVEARDLQVFVWKSGKFRGHFAAWGRQCLPSGGAINPGDETGVAEHLKVLAVANPIGIEAGIWPSNRIPRFSG